MARPHLSLLNKPSNTTTLAYTSTNARTSWRFVRAFGGAVPSSSLLALALILNGALAWSAYPGSAASSKAEDARRVSGHVASVVFRASEYLDETSVYGTQIFVSITS